MIGAVPFPHSPRPVHAAGADRDKTKGLRACIWAYLILWLVEGALRKWFFPGLSQYLLLIREPLLVATYCLAVARGVFPLNGFVIVLGILSLLSLVIGLVRSEVSIILIFYGARSYFLHFPMLFLIGEVMNRRDVERVGRFLLFTAAPMTALMVMQFVASPNSAWNYGAGASVGGQMIGALGHARPSGTFSFANGTPLYLSLLCAFTIYGYTRGDLYPKWLLWTGLFSVLLGTVISVSRNAVFCVLIVLVAFIMMGVLYPQFFRKFLGLGFGVLALGGLLSALPVFSSGIDSLQSRFEDGGAISSSIGGRFIGDLVRPWQNFLEIDAFGIGMGRASSAAVAYTGDATWIIENEWLRTLVELGWILGTVFLALRVYLACWLAWQTQQDLRRGDGLGWLIVSASFINIFMTPLGLTTGQGFIVLCGGLCLAARKSIDDASASAPLRGAAVPAAPGRQRGRSLYADWLHGGASGPAPVLGPQSSQGSQSSRGSQNTGTDSVSGT